MNLYLTYSSEIARSLPEVTEEDNGKFLMVVDGDWAASTISRAEEVAF